MAVTQHGDYWYGDNYADIRAVLTQYSKHNVYVIDSFVDIMCLCGNTQFRLLTDDAAGVAVRRCTRCGHEHFMGDSADYANEADIEQHECLCGKDEFEIVVGIHRYRNRTNTLSDDVRWVYIGCRCPSCRLVGCYADWKNEWNDYAALLKMM